MKYYTNETFAGRHSCGGAAIIKARTKEHAAEVLTSELRKQGIQVTDPILPEDMVLWPLQGEQVRILNSGGY